MFPPPSLCLPSSTGDLCLAEGGVVLRYQMYTRMIDGTEDGSRKFFVVKTPPLAAWLHCLPS